MRSNREIAIVCNPMGGTANETRLKRLELSIRRAFPESRIYRLPTEREECATRDKIRQALPNIGLAIAVGGDGTVRTVAEALLDSGVPMAVFPGGTGNLFARTYGNYPPPEVFASMLQVATPQPIDILEVQYTREGSTNTEQRFVLVSMGFGKLSDAITDANPRWKKMFGSLAYAAGMLRASFDPSANSVSFCDVNGASLGDGFEKTPVSLAAIFNVAPPHLINISRGCNASDGRLDLVVFRARNMAHLANAAMWLAIGKPERSRFYARRQLDAVTFTSSQPMHLNLDGDSGGHTRSVTVRVRRGAVQMVLA